jgi:hypothetical protein
VDDKINEGENMKIENGYLKISDEENYHITSIDLFTGGDISEESVCYKFVNDKDRHGITMIQEIPRKLNFRPRFELGVRIYIEEEATGKRHSITVCHHKGGIAIESERCDGVAAFRQLVREIKKENK